MVDHDGVAGEIEIMCEHDASAVRRLNRSAGGTEKVGAAMRLTCLAVENAARAERPVCPTGYWSNEAGVPQAARLGLCPQLLDLRSFTLDASDDRRWWIDERVIDLEHASAEFTGRDVEFSLRCYGLPGSGALEWHLVRPGLGIDIDAEERPPSGGI